MPEVSPTSLPSDGHKRPSPKRVMRKVVAHSHAGRSNVFRWLYRHHAQVSEALAKLDPSWQSIADMMVAEGVTGRAGSTPNADSVPKVWARVCRDIEASRRAGSLAKGRKKPAGVGQLGQVAARSSDGGIARATPKQVPQPPSRPSLLVREDPLPATDPALILTNEGCTPEEMMAGLRRILKHRSGQ